jgi:hypothetical protein
LIQNAKKAISLETRNHGFVAKKAPIELTIGAFELMSGNSGPMSVANALAEANASPKAPTFGGSDLNGTYLKPKTIVIASEAKQSNDPEPAIWRLLRRCAPRNDGC